MTLFILETCEAVMADYKCSHYAKGKCKARLKAMIEVISDEDTNNAQKKLLLTLNGQHTCSILHQHEIVYREIFIRIEKYSQCRGRNKNVCDVKSTKLLLCCVEVYNKTKKVQRSIHYCIKGTFYHDQTTSQMKSLVDRT